MFNKCPEALMHIPDTRTGRCIWCNMKCGRAYKDWFAPDRSIKANDVLAYEYFFNPDFGLDYRDTYSAEQ